MYYGVPLHIIRDLYLTVRSFAIRVKDIIRYRKATANMNERYPDATEEELSGTDRVCIICREEMTAAKKLPCGHFFHFRCLRSWLERQQACPTCRRPIFDDSTPTPQDNNRDNQPAHQGAMVWRNGHWEPLNAGQGQPGVPLNPELRERPDVPANNAGPAVVFPNLQPPAMAGNVIPGPFGTIPVILIPPDQIAVVQPPHHPRTPDPPPVNINEDQAVPRRPYSTSPISSNREYGPIPPKTMYLLKSGHGQQNPIYLEPLGSDFPVISPVLSTASNESFVRDADIKELRSSVKQRLRAELATLTQLQSEIALLTERLIVAESRLEALESESMGCESVSGGHGESSRPLIRADDESDTRLGKEKL